MEITFLFLLILQCICVCMFVFVAKGTVQAKIYIKICAGFSDTASQFSKHIFMLFPVTINNKSKRFFVRNLLLFVIVAGAANGITMRKKGKFKKTRS